MPYLVDPWTFVNALHPLLTQAAKVHPCETPGTRVSGISSGMSVSAQ